MIELRDILKGLREQKQVSMDKMCEDLNYLYDVNLAKSTISKWENGKAEPSLAYARILTKYFDVTLDYLLGLEKEDVYNFNALSKLEASLLENFNKLNTLGKEKLLEYSNDLVETPKYIN
jgi:transcriptional regulator with XRE-family HTH domain